MDNNIKVIGPSDMTVINPDGTTDEPEQAIDGPLSKLDVKLLRSKNAVEQILAMPAVEALDFLDNQMMAVSMLVNEETLRWLTVLRTSKSKVERAEAAVHINNLIAGSAKMTETKIKLVQAIGLDRLKSIKPADAPQLGDGRPKIFKKTNEVVTEDEFNKRFGHLVPNGETPPSV